MLVQATPRCEIKLETCKNFNYPTKSLVPCFRQLVPDLNKSIKAV